MCWALVDACDLRTSCLTLHALLSNVAPHHLPPSLCMCIRVHQVNPKMLVCAGKVGTVVWVLSSGLGSTVRVDFGIGPAFAWPSECFRRGTLQNTWRQPALEVRRKVQETGKQCPHRARNGLI